MADSIPMVDDIISNLKKVTSTIVIKYNKLAMSEETLQTRKSFDYYELAMCKRDTFNTYPSYSEEAIRLVGVTDEDNIKTYMSDKKSIPVELRQRLLEIQRFIVIRDFEEKNNYYRQYLGLPKVDDADFVYVDEDTANNIGVDYTTPIHLLHELDLTLLYSNGYINKLKEKYPSKTYLSFMGPNKLDIFTMRKANNFSIIKINKSMIPDKLFRDFMSAYESSREYFTIAIYNKDFSKMYKMYDNIIGFLIMCNTIRIVICNTFKNGIDRDFYDINSISRMLSAYNIKFSTDQTIEQQRIILRNINNLLRIRSSDRVIIEISNLLGLSNLDIYKYYLVKKHKRDINNNPVFLYKDVPNIDGTTHKELDLEKMYELNFTKVNLKEKNVALALSKPKNKLDYDKVTSLDPYWWDDEDLKNEIFQNEFNYLESKYISFDIVYRMSRLVFESIYFLSMLHDRKDETSNISLLFPRIDPTNKINLFEICILLFALTAKKNNYKGNISSTPTTIGYVLGFSFKRDLKKIIDDIKNDDKINDPELINYISDMSINSFEDIDRLYSNIHGFKKYIEEKIYETNDKYKYNKYMDIYKTLMTTEYMGDLFQLPDGDVAKTYKEYLMYTNYKLYTFLEDIDKDNISEIIVHIITKIEECCESLKYIHLLGDGMSNNINTLYDLINFFKSYTVDIQQFNVLYIFDDRLDNLIKMIDNASLHTSSTLNDEANQYDTMSYVSNIYDDDNITFNVRTAHHIYSYLDDRLYISNIDNINDKISEIRCVIMNPSNDSLICDDESLIHNSLYINEKTLMTDVRNIISSMNINDRLYNDEKIRVSVSINQQDILKIEDRINTKTKIETNDSIIYYDKFLLHHLIELNTDNINIDDLINTSVYFSIYDRIITYDTISSIASGISLYDNSLKIKDVLKIPSLNIVIN